MTWHFLQLLADMQLVTSMLCYLQVGALRQACSAVRNSCVHIPTPVEHDIYSPLLLHV